MKPSGLLSFWQVPEDAGDPDVKVYVNGELVEAGSGSGDFTTASVTLTGNDVILVNVAYLVTSDGETQLVTSDAMTPEASPMTIPLYKGKIVLVPSGSKFESVTANNDNASIDSDGNLVITGDVEITSVEVEVGGLYN